MKGSRNLQRGKRLVRAREARRLTQDQLADAVLAEKRRRFGRGVTLSRGAVGNWELGGGMTADNLACLVAVLNVPESWLLSESGPKPDFLTSPALPRPDVVPEGQEFPPDPDPDAGEELPPDPDEPMTFGKITGRRGFPDGTSPQLDVTGGLGAGGVTIVSEGVAGKRGMTFAAEHVADFWRLPVAILAGLSRARPEDICIIPVQGDSMQETLDEGDFVFIDTRHRLPSPDGLYALGDEFGNIVVKRLEVASGPGEADPLIAVLSDNPKHARKERRLSEMHIIGRVVRRFGVVR